MKAQKIITVGEDVENLGPPSTVGGNVKEWSLRKTVWQLLKKSMYCFLLTSHSASRRIKNVCSHKPLVHECSQ